MNKTLTAVALVYIAGVIVTRLTIDTSKDSDFRVSLGWPYYLVTDTTAFTTGIRSALKGAVNG